MWRQTFFLCLRLTLTIQVTMVVNRLHLLTGFTNWLETEAWFWSTLYQKNQQTVDDIQKYKYLVKPLLTESLSHELEKERLARNEADKKSAASDGSPVSFSPPPQATAPFQHDQACELLYSTQSSIPSLLIFHPTQLWYNFIKEILVWFFTQFALYVCMQCY